MHSTAYTFRFAIYVTLVCSVLLAAAATVLKPRQVENQLLEMKKNILVSVDIRPQEGESFTRELIQAKYDQYIKGLVINENGEILPDRDPGTLDPKKEPGLFGIYERIEDGDIKAYVFPVSGKGLWSTIYGYLALAPDMNTVVGITFYQHGETPGLGGEIEKDWFTSNFVGKKIRNDQGEIVSINVVKGKVDPNSPEAYHQVDGISGSTLTGRGVTNFLKSELKKYEPFMQAHLQIKKGEING
ncbi:MAG: NADH:ubiquinone reductase (Na(+)-transporting) subunit C [Calditrichaceae bacterium]|nr:NADH:ubiquinone reductase (Na(+)-transporting) subunit C [Calditrichaceae bacterium]MBN2709999.1 NADH:ubiquinone reductase (Na(+)-transporting) subunit C [Calditrichaceae bacterium]RQV97336.1 MAG: NADH:ubiquinone reductase (Na(+)-transporting) subunit C [Calditrichota bacterium]